MKTLATRLKTVKWRKMKIHVSAHLALVVMVIFPAETVYVFLFAIGVME